FHRIPTARARAGPHATRRELHVARSEVARDALLVRPTAADIQAHAVTTPLAKSHQRFASVEVHADPVPADGLVVHVGVAPLVVEPGAALDCDCLAVERERTVDCQLGAAVVVACLAWLA